MRTSTSGGAPPARSAVPALPKRHFQGNRYVYSVLSQRAGGLSVGINLTPDGRCDFDCVYCEVERDHLDGGCLVEVPVMISELDRTLRTVEAGRLDALGYDHLTPEQMPFKGVALSGEGEPTLCPNFREVVEGVVTYRRRGIVPFFKLVLITNGSGLGFPDVRNGIALFSGRDEVWAKLDAGTQTYMDVVNRADVPIDHVLGNILGLARERPVVIQSLFPLLNGAEPPREEIDAYADCLRELRENGARIPLVQVYSAHRAAVNSACGHLPLRSLSRIARRIHEVSGLRAEVF